MYLYNLKLYTVSNQHDFPQDMRPQCFHANVNVTKWVLYVKQHSYNVPQIKVPQCPLWVLSGVMQNLFCPITVYSQRTFRT